ncbi:hypothetical protein [Salipiger aestuarii]|nr:hypothetical protein [Salipiger aestuarii]
MYLDTDDGLGGAKSMKGTNAPITVMKVAPTGEGEAAPMDGIPRH